MTWIALRVLLREIGRVLTPKQWVALGVAIGVMGAIAWHLHTDRVAIAEAKESGRKSALEAARFDSALRAIIRKQVDTAQRRTDSVRTVVRWRVASVDSQAIAAATLAHQLPPSVDTLPAVVALKDAVFTLAATVKDLRADIHADSIALADERKAVRAAFMMDSTAIESARLANIAQRDTITTLTKRPTRRKALLWSVGGALLATLTTYAVMK